MMKTSVATESGQEVVTLSGKLDLSADDSFQELEGKLVGATSLRVILGGLD